MQPVRASGSGNGKGNSGLLRVTFPQFAKIEVNGEGADPLYVWLKKQKRGLLGSTSIKWNFTKFLIDRQGNVVERFAPGDTPEQIEPHIKKLLG